mmetsp:Transcript_4902/g.13953  ORF Transcript_4902/g.13953 Transcript_4902/m.13953 type:complete len:564 (-) Transcript_4902:291-1982(-)
MASADPFNDLFSALTLGPGGAYGDQPALGATPIPEVKPGAAGTVPGQPVAPMSSSEDAWGLVPSYNNTPAAAAAAAAAAPAGAIMPAAAPPLPPPDALPEGWAAYKDPGSGKEYYHHAVTGQVTWDRPLPPSAAIMPAASPASPASPAAATAATATAATAATAADGNPFSVFDAHQPAAADPFAANDISITSTHSVDSDFGVMAGPPAAVAAAAATAAATAAPMGGGGGDLGAVPEDDGFWSQMGFGVVPVEQEGAQQQQQQSGRRKSMVRASLVNMPDQGLAHMQDDDMGADRLKNGLPSGKTYEAVLDRNIYRLGAVFLNAKMLKPNLYCKISNEVIVALGNRPIVAYIANDAAAYKAGVQPGEILLKVGDKDATSPKQARELIQAAERPLKLTLLCPDLPIIMGENQHMVKYSNNKTRAPTQMKDWKAKYVVVGGLAAAPYALLMYYSKGEYDKAVADNLAHRHHSVKIKAFDLRGCTVVEDQTVQYTGSKLHFFIIVPPKEAEEVGGFMPNNIKISHPVKEGLTPVMEAVKRVIEKYPNRPTTTAQQQPGAQKPDRGYY